MMCSTPTQVRGHFWGDLAHNDEAERVPGTRSASGCRGRRGPELVRRAPYGSCGPHAQGGCRCAGLGPVCGAGLGPASLLLLAEPAEAPVLLGVPEALPVKDLRQVELGVHVSAFRDAGCRSPGVRSGRTSPTARYGPDGRHRGVPGASQGAGAPRTSFIRACDHTSPGSALRMTSRVHAPMKSRSPSSISCRTPCVSGVSGSGSPAAATNVPFDEPRSSTHQR